MRRLQSSSTDGVLGSPVRNLVAILVFMGVVVVLATLAYMNAGWSFADAIYMVTLTVYTVGYDEVRPIDTPYLHAVTLGLIVLGCTGMILLTSSLVQLFTVMQLTQILGTNRMQSRIEKLTDHVIVCGYGRIGVMLAKELADARMPLVVLESDPAKGAEAEAAGHLVLVGDATAETVLVEAGIVRARVLASVLPDDAANVFITLSARNLNRHVEIIARGEVPSTERKLRHAGANQVVLPTHIGAERMARLVLFPESAGMDDARFEQLAKDVGDLGLQLELVVAAEASAVTGLTVADAERRGAGAFFIVQIDHAAGGSVRGPGPADKILAGDRVLLLARGSGGAADTLFTQRAEVRVGRNVF